MANFKVADFLENAPTGLVLFSKSLNQSLEFNEVKHDGPQRIIECLKYDDAGNLTGEKVYFDTYGRIKQNICGDITDSDADLMPDEHNGWDNYGICALIVESSVCIGKVLMDKSDSDDGSEYPWIVGNAAMWTFDNGWDYARFHKFDFSNVRFADAWETRRFFDTVHRCGLDFKDGAPIKNDKTTEPECKNTTKELFFNVLTSICGNWKGTIPDADFQEVLFKFNAEVIIPELEKAFGRNSEIIADKV